jgi:hypothetical protein
VLEIIVRGSVMYLTLVLLLCVVLKRQTGTLAMPDLWEWYLSNAGEPTLLCNMLN